MKTANQIKKELKEMGFNTKKISVKVKNSTMSTSLNVTIKCPQTSKSKVEEVLNKYRDVRYCEASGEILSGGNTYVIVSYEWGLENEVTSPEFEKAVVETVDKCFCDGFHIQLAAKCFMENYMSPLVAPELMLKVLCNIFRANREQLRMVG